MLATAVYGPSEIVKVDPEGRILLSDAARAYAGLAGEATFVGLGRKFQIWEPNRFQAHLAEAKRRVRALRTEFGAQETADGARTPPPAREHGNELRAAGNNRGPAGGPARHIPVLLREAMRRAQPRDSAARFSTARSAPAATRARCSTVPATRVVALDRDPTAIARGRSRSSRPRRGRLDARRGAVRRSRGARARASRRFAGIVLDIGVSSMQLDDAARGFSFRHDAPLDMRMSASGRTAADILAEASEEEIADILYHYGEERASRRIARAIVASPQADPVTTTGALAELVEGAARAEVRRDPSGDAHVPGVAHRRQRRARRTCRAPSPAPKSCWRRAGGSSSSPSIRWKTAS